MTGMIPTMGSADDARHPESNRLVTTTHNLLKYHVVGCSTGAWLLSIAFTALGPLKSSEVSSIRLLAGWDPCRHDPINGYLDS